MLKRVLAIGALVCLPGVVSAGWEVGGSYVDFSDDDISLGALAASVGYSFPSEGGFSFTPELRVGFGMSDDDIAVNGVAVKVELDQLIGLNLRTKYSFSSGAYLLLLPSYTKYEISAEAGGFSVSEDTTEFGIGVGGGFQINDAFALEAAFEKIDDADALSLSLRVLL